MLRKVTFAKGKLLRAIARTLMILSYFGNTFFLNFRFHLNVSCSFLGVACLDNTSTIFHGGLKCELSRICGYKFMHTSYSKDIHMQDIMLYAFSV